MALRLSKIIVLIVIVSSSFIIFGTASQSTSAQGSSVQGPFVGPLVQPGSFTGDLRQLPNIASPSRVQPPGRMMTPQKSLVAPITDPVRQASPATVQMPPTSANFDGLDMTFDGGSVLLPPDPNGDANANYFVQSALLGIGIFDKMTGKHLVTTTMASLWSVAKTNTPCDTNHVEDPVVLYDTIARRWLLTDMAWIDTSPTPASNFYQCVAVSKTNDPITGGWWFYGFLIDADRQVDYSRLAIWSDGYYMSSNMFTPWNVSSTFLGESVWAMDRSAMINGAATQIVKFFIPCGNPCYASLLPSNLRGSLPPSGTPNFFASIDAPNLFHLWKFHVDWTTPISSTFSPSPTDLTVANFSWNTNPFAQVVPQMSASQPNLQLFGDRLMMPLQYRNIGGVESLWANHSVYGSGGVIGIRWYEIRNPNGTPSVYQQGTFQPDTVYRWMGSLGVDHNGNMAVGYSASNASMFPAIRYAGRLITDTLGTIGQTEQVLYQGTGPESDIGGWGSWGDYSGMSVDPIDDCTFWYTSEYLGTTGNIWRTRIGAFKYPSCNPTPYPTNHTIMLDGAVTPNIEWNPNGDKLGTMGGYDYYATWDANNLYVSMTGGSVNANQYVVVVDTDSTNHTSSNTGATVPLVCAGFNANGKGDYALERSSGTISKYKVTSSAWMAWTPSATTNAFDNGSNNVEFQFNWSDLGLAPTSPVGLYLYVCNGTTLVSAWSPENLQSGINPTLDVETSFASNDSGRIPRTFGKHFGDERLTLTNGGSFNFLNGYVQLANVSGLSDSCMFSATVTGDQDTEDTTIIRRTYALTPVAGCTGLTANLTLKYEDGTAATNAPDEKNGVHTTLHLLRQVNGVFQDQCPGVPTCTYPSAGQVRLNNVNQFSIWTLGAGRPSNILPLYLPLMVR